MNPTNEYERKLNLYLQENQDILDVSAQNKRADFSANQKRFDPVNQNIDDSQMENARKIIRKVIEKRKTAKRVRYSLLSAAIVAIALLGLTPFGRAFADTAFHTITILVNGIFYIQSPAQSDGSQDVNFQAVYPAAFKKIYDAAVYINAPLLHFDSKDLVIENISIDSNESMNTVTTIYSTGNGDSISLQEIISKSGSGSGSALDVSNSQLIEYKLFNGEILYCGYTQEGYALGTAHWNNVSLTIGSATLNWDELYTCGQLPFTGFAMQNKKEPRTELPYKIARDNKAVFAITGQYASDPKNPKGIIICNGKVQYDKSEAPTMAFMPTGEMKVYEPGETTAKKLLAMGVKDAFSFGPILVKDGKACPGLNKTKRLEYSSWRVGVGQTDPGHYIIIVTNRGVYLNDFAQLFVQYGCRIAYNLDGGYSAAIVFMGEQLNKNSDEAIHQRKIPDMLIIGTCGAVPAASAPVYGNGIHYNGAEPAPTNGPLHIP